MEEIERKRRNKLHAKIIECGWPSIRSFGKEAGYSESYMYLLISGRLHPSRALQAKLCEMLNLSIKDLRDLL